VKMASRMNGFIAKTLALALATIPALMALTVGTLLDGHFSVAMADKGGNGKGGGSGDSGGNGAGGEGNGGAGGEGSGGASGGERGKDADNGQSGEHGKSASDGDSASNGDIDGDGTPGRSDSQGIGQEVSEAAKDDSTTGLEKAEAIHTITQRKFVVEGEVPFNR
jgi:hypothetical protein